jgi:hypothetical protein
VLKVKEDPRARQALLGLSPFTNLTMICIENLRLFIPTALSVQGNEE